MCGNSQESFTEKSGENVDRNFEEFLATHSEEFLVIHSREFLVTHSKEFLMTSFQEFRVTHSEEFLITLSKEFLVTNSREFLVTNSREFLVTKNNQRKFLETKCFILFPPPKKAVNWKPSPENFSGISGEMFYWNSQEFLWEKFLRISQEFLETRFSCPVPHFSKKNSEKFSGISWDHVFYSVPQKIHKVLKISHE